MDVALVTMSTDQAERALRGYRDNRRKTLNAEFDDVEKAYAQLAKGTPLVDVRAAIMDAPRDDKGRPMIAVAQAHRKQVKYEGASLEESFDSLFDSRGGRAGADA